MFCLRRALFGFRFGVGGIQRSLALCEDVAQPDDLRISVQLLIFLRGWHALGQAIRYDRQASASDADSDHSGLWRSLTGKAILLFPAVRAIVLGDFSVLSKALKAIDLHTVGILLARSSKRQGPLVLGLTGGNA